MLNVCNFSLEQGVFPHSLIKARVIPVFKSGDKNQLNNFRPISILYSLGKVIEKILSVQLETYFNENNLLTPAQFAFRRGIFTEDAVQNL